MLILKGMADVFIVIEDGKSTVLEVLQEGEVIGFSNIAYYLGESNRPYDRHQLEIEVVEDSYCLQIPFAVVKQRFHDEAVRDSILRRMPTRLANVYASLIEQIKTADDWGDSEPYVRRVKEFMNSPARTVTEDVTVQEIAQLLVEHSISSVMVVDDAQRLTGIITEKDLALRVIAQ
ncbi:CBS domain-containing protein [Sporosarcina sp. NPDC096371]|uniref:CBS domain-containing protein n=1 Tax=Sporosarcina sp. NPDC096371 TaxID=3364530 RepID=UPI0037F4E509